MGYYVRKATIEDLDPILLLFDDARVVLQNQGIPQWQNGTGPTKESTKEIISLEQGYVLIEDVYIKGFGTITTDIQMSYEQLVDGKWNDSEKYVSIHSFTIHSSIKRGGMAFFLLTFLISTAFSNGYKDIRIDTHPVNHRMKKVIKRCGFIEQGIIHLEIENGERIAYQLII